MLLAKKNSDEQVLLSKDQAWMESSNASDHEINANMVFMAQIEKVLSESDKSSSPTEETIAEVAYYISESKSESEFETLEYYDNSSNYGLFVNNDDDQEVFHDAIESASENLIENHIDSQKDYDKSEKRIEKANQQSKDLENQNKDLQEKYDVLLNQENTFEEQNNEFNEQIKVLNKKNVDFLSQTKVLQDQLKVKYVVIDTHTECQAQYAKLEEERYEYMIRYSALCDNDKQHRKKIDEQEILFDKMSLQLVEMNNNVLRLQEKILEKETKISELEGCVSNKDVEIEKCLERLNECENKLHKIGQTNQKIHMIMPSKDTLYNGRKGIGFENPSYFRKSKDLRTSLYDEKVIGLGYTLMFLIHSDEALEIEKFKRARENKIEFAYDYRNLNASYVNEKIKFLDDYFQEIINPDSKRLILRFRKQVHLNYMFRIHLKLNQNVKRYSRKDLLSCNNSHLGETSSAYVCNDAMNVSCNSRMCDLFDENNLFIFDDESVRIFPVSKMPFRKKPRDSLNDVGKLKAKGDIGVFVGNSKESAAFRIYNKQTLSQVSETSKKDLFQNFYDEYFDSSKIMKSLTTNVETSINEEVFHEVSESFQGESSSFSLNDDVQQSLEEVGVPSSNTQSISINMIPNIDEASTSHNVYNVRLEDAYFDASTSFHDLSNVHTFYQPYPHEKKWTKDHSLTKIIGDLKSSVRTRVVLIQIELHKSPTMSLLDVGSSRISIFIM
nr:hypothetical protein [Tanacetum cinerariifolium]